MRRHFSIFFTGIGVLLFLMACSDDAQKIGQPESYLPADFTTIIMTHDFSALLAEMQQNELLKTSEPSASFVNLLTRSPLLKLVKPNGISYLTLASTDSTSTFTFIAQQHANILKTDSISDLQLELINSAESNTPTIQKIIMENTAAFYSMKDSVLIASNSEINLRDILAGNTLKTEEFQKISRIHDKKDNAIFSRGSSIHLNQKTIADNSTWTAAELQLTSNSLVGNGVVITQDSLSFLSVFDRQIPQQNDLETVIPIEALSAYSFTFSDAALLRRQLQTYRNEQDTLSSLPLFGTINEIGSIRLNEGNIIALKSMDSELTQESWGRYISETDAFKEVQLFDWSAPDLFSQNFSPLIPSAEFKTAFQLGNFYFIAENNAAAEKLISAYKNQRTLDRSSLFIDAFPHISNASSLLVYEMENAPSVLQQIFPSTQISDKTSPPSNYPLSLLQYSYDRNFAHMHLVIQEANQQQQNDSGVNEQFNVALEQTIQLAPQFFINHKTRKNEVLTQDVANNLYLISDKGSILWKKSLSEPIIGRIHEVDLYRNGKIQMVFSTENALHV
ncbi:MAG: hypothetical protein HKM28_01115, partial [Flavobacteriaceae bacterium]|nr:hypothetical protein [Flavobacteriaceae bacterium]